MAGGLCVIIMTDGLSYDRLLLPKEHNVDIHN
jgi:hypothetical protein